MKAAQIELSSPRHLAGVILDRFAEKHPEHAKIAAHLKKSTTSILKPKSVDFETFEKLLHEIDQAADKLDNMYVYAAAQNMIERLNNFVRRSLAQTVPIFPEVAVSLKLSPSDSNSSASAKPGHRTKLGGQPQWIQTDETPLCDKCQKAMTFIGQIDSLAAQQNALGKSLSKKESFMFADAGMLYVFLCMKCFEAKTVVQSS